MYFRFFNKEIRLNKAKDFFNIISESTQLTWNIIGRNSSWVVPFQKYIRLVLPPSKMAPVTKNRES
jgi:hypothetical protein